MSHCFIHHTSLHTGKQTYIMVPSLKLVNLSHNVKCFSLGIPEPNGINLITLRFHNDTSYTTHPLVALKLISCFILYHFYCNQCKQTWIFGMANTGIFRKYSSSLQALHLLRIIMNATYCLWGNISLGSHDCDFIHRQSRILLADGAWLRFKCELLLMWRASLLNGHTVITWEDFAYIRRRDIIRPK